jgi:hypothetical protein
MARKKESEAKTDESVIVKAANVIGSAAGKVASLAGASPEATPQRKSQKVGKLQKKDKSRVPRKQKKKGQRTVPRGRID